MEIVKFTAFQVQKCGYYARSDPSPKFGGLAETLTHLKAWTKQPDRTLAETVTFSPAESASEFRTLCHDIEIAEDGTSAVLVTWNETKPGNEVALAVNGSHPVGQATVKETAVGSDQILGYPTYFFFRPMENKFYTIQFGINKNGHKSLCSYLEGFLTRKSPSVAWRPGAEPGDTSITGYRRAGSTDKPAELSPYYKSMMCYRSSDIDHLKKNVSRIRKMLRKEIAETTTATSSSWRNIFSKSSIGDAIPENSPIKVHYDINIKLTLTQLESVIQMAADERKVSGLVGRWNDVGFQLANDPKVYWLSRMIDRTELTLDITKRRNNVVPAIHLLEVLRHHPLLLAE